MTSNLTHPRVLNLLRTLSGRRRPGQVYLPVDGGLEVHQVDQRPDLLSDERALLAVPLQNHLDCSLCGELAFDEAGAGWVFFTSTEGLMVARLECVIPALESEPRRALDSLVARLEMMLLALAMAAEHPMGARRN